MRATSHRRGVVLAAAGALCLVPDATLIRLADADGLQVAFWRSLFIGIALTAITTLRNGRETPQAYRAIGRPGLAVAATWGLSFVLFVVSVSHTAVANTLVILATTPFFAALATRLLLGEAIQRRTWTAMSLAFIGVIVTFGGQTEVGGMGGNIAALAVAVVLGLNLTLVRRSAGVDMLPAISLAGFVAASVVFPAARPIGISGRDAIVIGALGLVFLPAAFGLLVLGTRHLPSPEVGLLMLLETVLGPLLAWAVVSEAPPAGAAVGGTIVVVAIGGHALLALQAAARARREPALATLVPQDTAMPRRAGSGGNAT